MIQVINGGELKSCLLGEYFKSLVNNFFKILPMKENNEQSLDKYVRSFQSELLGLQGFIPSLDDAPMYLRLLAILEYIADSPEAPVTDVKREVFKAIRICNRLAELYSESEVIS